MRLFSLISFLGLASTSHAALFVTRASVSHEFTGLPQYGSSSTPLVNAAPGNHFTTLDGQAGATLDINQTDGSLRVDTWGKNNLPAGGNGYSFMNVSGSIHFTAVDGDFTFTPAQGAGYTGITFTLTQLSTGLTREMVSAGPVQPTSSGSLNFPAPKGDYLLSWGSFTSYMAGTALPGYGKLEFAITPEPTLLGFAGLAPLARRRR